MKADEVLQLLKLTKLPVEGVYYRETYRSSEIVAADHLPGRYGVDHNLSTAIYVMLTPDTYTALHSVKSDEVYHFYMGAPVTMLLLYPDGESDVAVLGSDIGAWQRLQLTVPKGTWQGAFVEPGGEHDFALLGSTIAPGFDATDLDTPNHEELKVKWPEHAELIDRLSRKSLIPINIARPDAPEAKPRAASMPPPTPSPEPPPRRHRGPKSSSPDPHYAQCAGGYAIDA